MIEHELDMPVVSIKWGHLNCQVIKFGSKSKIKLFWASMDNCVTTNNKQETADAVVSLVVV